MLYTDALFLSLLFLLALAARSLKQIPPAKEALLAVFSVVVIASWGLYSLALFLIVVALNYIAALMIERASRAAGRVVLIIAITVDIAILAFFKYSNFLALNLSALFGVSFSAFPLGIPLAISFYTFHIISYLVDLHAHRIENARFGRYFLYLSFFPHVIAGPILRAWQFIPQLGRTRKESLILGLHYLVTGFFLKSVSADNIGMGIDPIWAGKAAFALTAADRWLVAFLYYCQIYSDFAGYSLMALGMARVLGYRFPANFRSPMLANSLQDFWRRWHITLSRWLRDYLYIPLGGNKRGNVRFNLLITMLLGGLWHGAGWGFVTWGAIHGVGLVLERAAQRIAPIRLWLITQLWVTIAWIFFRSQSIAEAMSFLKGMLSVSSYDALAVHSEISFLLIFAIPPLLHHLAPSVIWHLRSHLASGLGLATGVMIFLCMVIVSPSNTFIYFKF